MRRIFLIFTLAVATMTMASAQTAKYVFYFIGDGMGVNQVNGAEIYEALRQGKKGIEPLVFPSFPYGAMVTTYSASSPVTDSAAGGTALACGQKTYNSAIGVDENKNAMESIAYKAKKAGRRVGIATTVSINHATPGAFYAHQPARGMMYEIASEIPASGFDFFAGAGIEKRKRAAGGKDTTDIVPLIEAAGYTIVRGYDAYKQKAASAQKMILLQPENRPDRCLPYVLDRNSNDLTISQITEAAIDFLTRGKDTGFFLMVEGGKIDWGCHNKDAACAFTELKDMDKAVAIAYEFYKKHPKETLIVITADHETAGLCLSAGGYNTNLGILQHQKISIDELSDQLKRMRDSGKKYTWAEMKDYLSQKMGFWKEIEVPWEQEKLMRDAFEESFVKNTAKYEKTLYSNLDPVAVAARNSMQQLALVTWAFGSHSAGYVPAFAVGVGAEAFKGRINNIDIPRNIAKAAKYKW